ncbi:MAG: hypothetical protein R2705_09900 [Ilumatobacteraceae bacterium]
MTQRVARSLAPGERLVRSLAVTVADEVAGGDRGRTLGGTAPIPTGAGTSAPPRLHELDGVLAGRVLAIVTDRRIVFFHRRPWRATRVGS